MTSWKLTLQLSPNNIALVAQTLPSGVLEHATSLLPRLAEAAASVTRPLFRSAITIETKDDDTPVTRADKDAETAIRALIAQTFPDHGIIGEESGSVRADADFVWVIDPIDGTGAFICGVPTFTCLIGLLYQGTPILGLIDQPISAEQWIGSQGHGATFQGAPAKCRTTTTSLTTATLTATAPDMFVTPAQNNAFQTLSDACARTRFGYDAYGYGLLASGHVDLVAEASMKLHDIAALVPVVTGAGGVITDWQGNPLTQSTAMSGEVLAAATPDLHAQALAILSTAA